LTESLIGMSGGSQWPRVTSMETLERMLALRSALPEFRVLLAGSWRPDTAYPGSVAGSLWFDGNPRGQCGVSSVWLAEQLARQYSILSTFCRGSLIFDDDQAEDLPDHCWLEISAELREKLVLDLTCDQARGFDREIVFDVTSDLDRAGIYYLSRDRVDVADLPKNPVWPRYQKLLRNMAS
jgi:hypothetical protein